LQLQESFLGIQKFCCDSTDPFVLSGGSGVGGLLSNHTVGRLLVLHQTDFSKYPSSNSKHYPRSRCRQILGKNNFNRSNNKKELLLDEEESEDAVYSLFLVSSKIIAFLLSYHYFKVEL